MTINNRGDYAATLYEGDNFDNTDGTAATAVVFGRKGGKVLTGSRPRAALRHAGADVREDRRPDVQRGARSAPRQADLRLARERRRDDNPCVAKPESTRWSLIKKAAQGIDPDREDFARVYEAPARAYFTARWRSTPLFCDADDAVQEVLLDCLKEGGALTRVDADRPGGFRAYFYGILRTTALRFERTRARRHEGPQGLGDEFGAVPADEAGLSTAFDRVWGLALLREAVERHRETAEENGPAAQRRFEILRLRFDEGIPIREIAARWGEDAETLHNEQRQAKREFREALYEVVRLHYPASDDVAEECRKILATLA